MKVVVIKLPDAMKAALDRLRKTKGVNMSSFIRLAIDKALRRAA